MSHEFHPGHEVECILKLVVSGKRTDGGQRGGYACGATGGHCLPSRIKCEAYRAEEMEHRAERAGITQ